MCLFLLEDAGVANSQDDEGKVVNKGKKDKIRDYSWLYYDITDQKEIDYLADFLYLTRDSKLNKQRLGLHQERQKKKIEETDELGKRELPININSSNRKIMDVANSLQERLMKFGRLDVGKNLVAKKASSNINAYIQDDFIEDPEEVMITEDMETFETQYEDFFVVVGDMRKFETSKNYLDRIDLINTRNRANKNRELQRIKKNNRKRQENNEIKMLQNTNI